MTSLYGAMVDPVRNSLGIELELWDTGGGCTALIGQLEGGLAVYVTDAPNSEYGHEAHISDMPYRMRHNGQVGFAVGIYADENTEQVSYGEYPHAAAFDLPTLITRQLRKVRTYARWAE